MKKIFYHIFILSVLTLIFSNCKGKGDEPKPITCKMTNFANIDSIAYDTQGRLLSVHKYRSFVAGVIQDYRGSFNKVTARNADGLLTKVELYSVTNGDIANAVSSTYYLYEYDNQNRMSKIQEYRLSNGQFALWNTTNFAYNTNKITITQSNRTYDYSLDNEGNVLKIENPNNPNEAMSFEYGNTTNNFPKDYVYVNRFNSIFNEAGSWAFSPKLFTKYTKLNDWVEMVHTTDDKGYVIKTENKTYTNGTFNYASTNNYTYKCD